MLDRLEMIRKRERNTTRQIVAVWILLTVAMVLLDALGV
jgi:predicted nucleic acid-binding Zn ribbon protein